MVVRRLFKLLLALLVTAGLTIAPLATSAVGHPMAAAAMQMADSSDMTADMPCCPDQQKSKPCQDCPLFAVCSLMALHAGPSADAIAVRHPSREQLRPLDDMIADGLERPPPDHPPRKLV